jgi:hypothetical protein
VKSFSILVDPRPTNCPLDPRDCLVGFIYLNAASPISNDVAGTISLCFTKLDRNEVATATPSKGSVLCSQKQSSYLLYFVDCVNYRPCFANIRGIINRVWNKVRDFVSKDQIKKSLLCPSIACYPLVIAEVESDADRACLEFMARKFYPDRSRTGIAESYLRVIISDLY